MAAPRRGRAAGAGGLDLPAPPTAGPLAVACSGGMDSTTLLHRLAAEPGARDRGLRALHVDHGLHPRSGDWAEACRATCETLGLAFEMRRVDLAGAAGSLEAAAREARYAALVAMQRPGETIALAHHRDDQAETVLLRLLRGAGDGLAAMRPWRPFGSGWLWRPLLAVPRAAIEAYARAQGLHWVEDPSNASDRHDRNYLRHRVMPRLQERWPQADAALARSAALLATQADLLAGEDARRLAALQGLDPATLSVPGLLAEPPGWRARLLRAWLAGLGLPPLPTDAVATIETELLPARPDASARFEWRGAVMHRWRDLLHAGPVRAPLPADWCAEWTGEAPLALPTGDTLSLEPAGRFDTPLRVHARQGGERLVLPGRSHHTELKHALQDLGIPPWERPRLPLLSTPDGTLLAAADLVLSAHLADWLAGRGVKLRWQSG